MNDAPASLRDRLKWYAGAAIGPVATAGAQFLLSLALLVRLPVADFGRLSFLLVAAQFGIGLWSALFTAPVLVMVARQPERAHQSDDPDLAGTVAASLLALGPAAVLFWGAARGVGLAGPLPALFAAYAAMALLRHFLRTWALAHGRYRHSILSDLTFGGVLLAGVAALLIAPRAGLLLAVCLLAASVLAALLVLYPAWPALPRIAAAPRYRSVWRRDSRWSLLGVLTTEATVNSHSYLVTAVFGPAAFAPIAATALVIRPVTVAINALTEFERARSARWLAAGNIAAVRVARRHLRTVLAGIWALALAAGLLALAVLPASIVAARFDAATVALGAGLWFAVALARLLHAPEGVILQAAGRFRQLAFISVWTAAVSVAAVVGLAFNCGPVWSIAGVFLGEAAFALALWRAASRQLDPAQERQA